jgi:glyoxylase-like metal-dependent hydrolase (beta-lactamase superfamily II)
VIFTGDALVTHGGITGGHGPRIVSRAFTHDADQALRSLATLAEIDVPLVLPGHGQPFADGLAAATEAARQVGRT